MNSDRLIKGNTIEKSSWGLSIVTRTRSLDGMFSVILSLMELNKVFNVFKMFGKSLTSTSLIPIL